MIQMPLALLARWHPLWFPVAWGAVPNPACDNFERPWWRNTTRCDGVLLVLRSIYERSPELYDPRGCMAPAESYAEARVRIDKEWPLPKPPPMPGQVWAVLGEDHTWREVTFLGISNGEPRFSNGYLNLYRDAILVAGPTPWGRDVPWCPVAGDIAGTPLAAMLAAE